MQPLNCPSRQSLAASSEPVGDEPLFVCKACGKGGADVRPLFEHRCMGTAAAPAKRSGQFIEPCALTRRRLINQSRPWRDLLARMLPAIWTLEHRARRTGKAIASRIGLPIAAAITVPVIIDVIVVATIEGAERGGCYGAGLGDCTADYGTRRADRPRGLPY